MASKKWVDVNLTLDGSKIIDLLEFCEGKTLGEPKIRRIKHGGEDEETGEIKPRPTAREFILGYAAANPKGISTIECARVAGEKLGFPYGSIGSAINVLFKEKQLARIGKGQYKLAKKAHTPRMPAGTRPKPKQGNTIADRIINFVRSRQNGSGEGVMLADIKKAMDKNTANGVSPTITTMIAKKQLKRIAPGTYRVAD